MLVLTAAAAARDPRPADLGTGSPAPNAGLSLDGDAPTAVNPQALQNPITPVSAPTPATPASTADPVNPETEPRPSGSGLVHDGQTTASPTRLGHEDILIRRTKPRAVDRTTTTPWYRNGLVSLFVVLVVIVGAALLAKRVLVPSQAAAADVLRVLCRTHLSPKQSIALVQMGGRFAFIGVTPERITNLRVVEDPEEAAALRVQLRVDRIKRNGDRFQEMLTVQSESITDHLEPELGTAAVRHEQMTRTRDDVDGLLQKLRSYSRKLKAETNT